MTTSAAYRPVGEQLRTWRQRRRRSQLDLALDAEVSARHISFLETGRSLPSRQMLLHLSEQLDIPLRERNTLLVAAGFAPIYAETPIDVDDPAMRVARQAIDLVLAGHEPYPALAIDRHWNLVAANRAVGIFMEGIAPELLEPPVNVLRLSLHPAGLAPRIVNLRQWHEHILARLRRQIDATADPVLVTLHDELGRYAVTEDEDDVDEETYGDLVLPIRIRMDGGVLAFFTTTTMFGTPHDITLAELAIESFFPADTVTAEVFHQRRLESDAG